VKPLKHCHVLVTPTSYGKEDPALITQLEDAVGRVTYNSTGKPLSSVQLREVLPGVDGYIAGLDTIDRPALEAADGLQVVTRYGAGVDRVDLEAAKEKGVVVTNTPGANTVSVAELTVGLMLALARMIPGADASTKSGLWPRMHGVALEGKVIGLLGFGAIGKQVARRLRAFDCSLVAYDPVADTQFAREHRVQITPSIDELIQQADFLSLHLPAMPATHGMVDAAFLGKMKLGAYLINTARGELIDETALLKALLTGRLKGAALDAFAAEPPDASNPLLALPQVIATPHIGAHTDGATNAMGWAALYDCLAVLQGQAPKYPVEQHY
jgi:phosphoglycerate dehydrogenase-like enzyme